MKFDRFVAARRADWSELEDLVARARGRPERLGAAGVQRLGELYRAAAADLAIARRSFPEEALVDHLTALVGRARGLVYDSAARRGTSAGRFFASEYWRLVRARPATLAIAALLLLVPAVIFALWAIDDPARAAGMLPGEYRSVGGRERGDTDLGLSFEEGLAISGQIFSNNIRVSLLAFAGGIVFGLGTVAVVAYNGAVLGVIAGIVIGAGSAGPFTALVSPHGFLELSCIVVAAAAGLRMGWAIVEPGPLRRRDALVNEARSAIQVAIGTAPWLVVAGFIEGLVTPTGMSVPVAVAMGIAAAAVYWGLVGMRGRPQPVTGAPAPSP